MVLIPSAPQFNNRILAALPRPELDNLIPHLKPRKFKHYDSLLRQGQESKTVYFLDEGVASVVTYFKNGKSVEVGLVGREGMVNMAALIGTGSLPFQCFIQIPGSGYQIEADLVIEAFRKSDLLRQKLSNFLHAQLVQTAQTAACNRQHDVKKRLARWILTCRDRSDSNELLLTQEFLGEMLGAPRTTVTLAVSKLQQLGLIKHSRGRVTILNQKQLEKVVCECYRTVRDEFDRLDVL